jgi:hypothetical protein
MVNPESVVHLETALLQVQQGAEPLLERLDPPRRAAVLMALLGLVLTGVVLVACVMIGGRWVRRLAGRGVRSTPANKKAAEPWRDVLRESLPDAKTGDTVHIDKKSEDTQTD